jgi:hypothetical protein
MELSIAHDGAQKQEVFPNDLQNNKNLRPFREKIASTKANKSAIYPFLAAVELDMGRREPIGLKALFNVWLEKGNNFWLNPMDKNNGLGVLEEILLKFQGNVQVLSPIISLLTQLAEENISPRAFTEYVILPRLREEYNWRKWPENHVEALRIIAGLIIKAKDHSPFDQEHLGTGKTRLARDIVLVRYVGRPLAQFQLPQLRDKKMLEDYLAAWQKISLQEPLSLYFMRNNALHFIYTMSGKIDLVQLIAIVEQLPEIERSFEAAFPGGTIKLKNIKAINLYDYDIETAIYERKLSGFHSLDFANEINAYFNIVKDLLEKATGVYLCAYYAGLLKRYKNPYIAETISRLVRTIDDRGGMHIYKWHTEKLLKKNKEQMRIYLDFIEDNHGFDPDYPRIYLLFRDEEAAIQTDDVFNMAENLGLGHLFNANKKDSASYKDLLNAYIQEYPDSSRLITEFQQQLLAGQDRQWTSDFTRRIDQLNLTDGKEKRLFGPLLRSVIRGIGTGWASNAQKATYFTGLHEKYGAAQRQMLLSARTSFKMPVKPVGQTSAEKDALARKQINLVTVEKIWHSLCGTEQASVNSALGFINKWSLDLNEPLERAFEKKVSLEEELRETASEEDGDEVKKKLESDIAKQDKTINALEEKKKNYTVVIEDFNSLDDEQKFIVSLILAGASGKGDDEYFNFVSVLLLQRYKNLDIISSRMDYLVDDVSVDVISYQQLTYLLNLLETLFFALREDKIIKKILEVPDAEEDDRKDSEENLRHAVLQEILSPYLITKKKEVTIDALDAAARKMTSYAALQAERAKWQDILESMEEKSEKYFHDMEIYTSKTFIDSYYGDMGGICLSSQPQEILKDGFFVQRLADLTDGQIIGMSILYLSTKGFMSEKISARNYFQAFAFNPLASVLSHLTAKQQLDLYLQYRLNMEKISWMTKLPVVISGIETPWGLISNNGHFGNLIKDYEFGKETAKRVYNARGLSVYYSSEEYAKALVIIDPRGHEKLEDPSQVPTFYAHRELKIE